MEPTQIKIQLVQGLVLQYVYILQQQSQFLSFKEIEKESENTRITFQANGKMCFQNCKNGQVIAASTSKNEPSIKINLSNNYNKTRNKSDHHKTWLQIWPSLSPSSFYTQEKIVQAEALEHETKCKSLAFPAQLNLTFAILSVPKSFSFYKELDKIQKGYAKNI